MIPNSEVMLVDLDELIPYTAPSRTYNIEFDKNRINGYTDELDAICQAIYLILSSERYQHLIYSWDYGVELLDLYGKPIPYVMSEVKRRITEALTQDDRIKDVTDFEFSKNGNALHVSFVAQTDHGLIEAEREVEV